ncbi:CTP synthase [[Clostridium] symbiosum]|uniref:CTP synthase n=1 Tax=Clostridium symbiosum TaxID=1512 RepID=UPI0033130744
MDEMKIVSKFTTNMISKLVKMVLRKRLGYDIDIQLNEIKTTITDGKTHVHLDVDAELEKEELVKILKKIGLS